jgi:hypothetical protein
MSTKGMEIGQGEAVEQIRALADVAMAALAVVAVVAEIGEIETQSQADIAERSYLDIWVANLEKVGRSVVIQMMQRLLLAKLVHPSMLTHLGMLVEVDSMAFPVLEQSKRVSMKAEATFFHHCQ